MGILQKTAKFLGIDKLGQGLASAGRVFTGSVDQDREVQQEADASVQKLLYVARQETDPQKKQRLLDMAGKMTNGTVQEGEIDPGLNLSNKEVLGSAANVALNIATPGAFKGGKGAILAKNAALGGAFGAAQGFEKDRSTTGVIGSAVGGAAIGGAVGGVGLLASAVKKFVGTTTPEWLMNKAVKPALDDLKKSVKFGTPTLGKELLDEGVKGGPQKLLDIARARTDEFESQLQNILNDPTLAEVSIPRDRIYPYLRDLVEHKTKVPGGGGDIQRIKAVYESLPDTLTLPQANEMKRAIYTELREVAYKLDSKLSVKGKALKSIARGLKQEIENEVGGNVISDINKKLSIYGRLEDSMVDQLARELRNNGVSLTDAILATGSWPSTILGLLRHTGQGTQTYTAQGLKQVDKLGTGIVGKALKGTVKRAALNAP